MVKFGGTGQRVLKIIHFVFIALWIGGAVGLNALLLGLGPPETAGELLGFNHAAMIMDDLVIIPGAMGSLITGILICAFTHWGFFKHRWVVVKLILTIVCIVCGIVVLGPTVNNQPEITLKLGLKALADPTYHANYVNCLLGGAFQLSSLIFMTVISVAKPWRKKKMA
ncbi:MAG: DUF2269 family protein [Deltaproteobacteria bacterium]|jgi:hypothetical protein|nr:DUF2269 family protein [Deltaproteobacteria bacterium]